MTTTTIDGRAVEVNEEGFLTDPQQWDEALGTELARLIGITMTDAHWVPIHLLRKDFEQQGETATLRRVSLQSGMPVSGNSKSPPTMRASGWITSCCGSSSRCPAAVCTASCAVARCA